MDALIRLANINDAADIAAIYNFFVKNTAITFEIEPVSIEQMQERITTILSYAPWLVVQSSDGTIMGYAYASKHRQRQAYQWAVETSVYIHRDFWRKGLARKLYEQLFKILQQQGYQNLLAGITIPNQASEAFHKDMGFSLVGVYKNIGYKQDQWHHVAWYERFIGLPTPPTAIKRLDTISLEHISN